MAMSPLSDDVDREDVVAEINVTPLTDIFLVLLIVFMVTSTTLTQAGLNVNLPRSRTASSQAQGVTITAAADGTVLVDSQPTTLADMGRLLQTAFARGRERTVTIRGDERVGLGTVVAIMDVARRAGAEKIGVATRPGDR
ncbi:MAG TPA: biopolymer transporter ExbD [Methylomirabilota bacterium]|nr:biopolymer transporter ExbD [Methylomirabilota bacterium]